MRGLLIFLACCGIAALASPSFWWLVASEYGAAPSIMIDQNGQAHSSLIGPRAPWPDWARLPGEKKLTVRSAAPTNGFGVVELEGSRNEQRPALEQALRNAGWQVRTWRQVVSDPDRPAQPATVCVVQAVQHAKDTHPMRALLVQFWTPELAQPTHVFWYESLVPQPLPGQVGNC